MRATTFCVAGSRMAREFSALLRTRSTGVGVGDCARASGALTAANKMSVTMMVAAIATAWNFIFIRALRLGLRGNDSTGYSVARNVLFRRGGLVSDKRVNQDLGNFCYDYAR